MFLASQILRGGRGAPKKLYPCHHPYLAARHLAKVHEATQPGSKVIAANMLNFKPIFDYHLKITVRGTPVPNGKCAIKIWSFSSACKILGPQHPLGAKIWFFKKDSKRHFGCIQFDLQVSWLLDQRLPDFFRWTREKPRSIKFLSDSEYLYSFQRYLPSKLEVVQNRAKFCMFLAPNFF